MNELTLDGKTYVSSKRAAEITGYAKDYVGQLCREGRIEARLVGRNWYILESAIREHRFGKDEAETAPVERVSGVADWQKPRYAAEEVDAIPSISDRVSVNMLHEAPAGESKAALVSDMQSAWQEWFSRKEEVKEAEEPEQSLEQGGEVEEGEVEEVELVEETEGEPVTIHSLEEADVEQVVEAEATRQYAPLDLTGERESQDTPVAVLPPRRKSSKARNALLRSVFVGVSLVAIALTAIGTGFAEQFSGLGGYRLSEINFIAGVSEFNR